MRGTIGGNNGLPNVGAYSQQNPGVWGAIAPNSQQDVVNFLSSGNVQVGDVTSSGCRTGMNEPCQIDFNVSVNPGGAPPNYQALQLVQTASGYQSTGSGVLTVAVYDAYTGTIQGGSSAPLSAIGAPADLVSAQMVYNGNSGSAYLVFSNAAGQVTMGDPTLQTMNISGKSFSGPINYQYNNAAGTGLLGTFTTNICYVFACNN